MDQITTYLKDPAWWFSAFFVAIIASVIAAFAKDRIERWFGTVSAKSKQRQAIRAAQREKIVNALACNEGFLTIAMIRTVGFLVLELMCFVTFLLSPMISEVLNTWCATVPVDPTCGRGLPPNIMSSIVAISFGGLSMVVGYLGVSHMRLTMQGYQRYRRKNHLPTIR